MIFLANLVVRREAKERAQRLASAPTPLPRPTLSDFIQVTIVPNEEQLCLALNRFLDKYSSEHVAITEEFHFPLPWFESSEFSEKMSSASIVGEKIVYLHEDKVSYGTWRIGTLMGVTDFHYKVDVSGESVTIDGSMVCSVHHNFSDMCDRITDALSRRHQVTTLLLYHHVVANVPCDPAIVPIMLSYQLDKIKAKACTLPLEQCSPIVLGQELDTIQHDFKLIMNRVVLNAVLRSSHPIPLFVPLDFTQELPWLFTTSKKAPKLGCISLPPHDMRAVKINFEKTAFLCSSAAMRALEGTVKENYHIQQLSILPTTYRQSHTLQSFERVLGDTLTSAIRAIKQEWPQRTAAAIRKALTNDPKKRYDLNVRNVHEYEVDQLFAFSISFNMRIYLELEQSDQESVSSNQLPHE